MYQILLLDGLDDPNDIYYVEHAITATCQLAMKTLSVQDKQSMCECRVLLYKQKPISKYVMKGAVCGMPATSDKWEASEEIMT